MTKIKSTLELVMERTKDISLNQTEKDALKRKEWEDKARGWAAMLVDHKISIQELMKNYSAEASHYAELSGILRTELLNHLDPDADNSIILEALHEVLGFDEKPIAEVIRGYHDQCALHRQEHYKRVLLELKVQGISGSALVPNLDGDESWIAFRKDLKDRVVHKIRKI